MQLTTIEYDAIMQAINNYKSELEVHGLAQYPDVTDYTAPELLAALNRVEDRIIADNIPR